MLRLGLSYLNEHRFNPNFENCLSPKCNCSSKNALALHFFLHCFFLYYISIRKTLFEEVKTIDANLLKVLDCKFTEILSYDENRNRLLLI